ncbi:MAG: 2Fe-2S iron-sulfur cluster-binding protein [Myxococcales bacterium]
MAEKLSFTLDGERRQGVAGDTVASALLRERVTTFTRSIKYHRPRGPFCFSGTCGQCLLRVDGVPSLPACRVPLEEGMVCERQNGPLGMDADVLRASDFLFPTHLDHHHLLTGSRLAGRVALEIARRLAGLGKLPDVPRAQESGSIAHAQVVVVGAGPAGIAAARAAAGEGAQVLLVERSARLGGAALLELDPEGPDAGWVARETERLGGVEVILEGAVLGVYPNDIPRDGEDSRSGTDAPALLAVRRRSSLIAVVAERVVVASGGISQPLPFAGVDRPGVYAARGLLDLFRTTGVRVGSRICVVGEGAEVLQAARALRKAGYALARVVDVSGAWPLASGPVAPPPAGDLPLLRARELRARGNPVRELRADSERIACDAVAVALPPAPLHELASAAGAQTRFAAELNGFPVAVDAGGRTSVSWLFAAGRVAGAPGAAAPRSGSTAGVAATRSLEEVR